MNKSFSSMLATFLSGVMLVAATACGDGKPGDDPQASNTTTTDTTAKNPVPVANIDNAPIPIDIDTTRPSATMPKMPAVTESVPIRTPDGQPARYAVKSGRLTFQYDGDLRGERIITFDNYGLKEHVVDRFMPFPIDPMTPKREMTTITTLTEQFSLQSHTNKAYRLPNSAIQDYLGSDSANTVSLAEFVFARRGMKKIKDETIQGYPTTLYEIASPGGPVRMWYWKGLPIREEGEFTKMNKRHALLLQKIELNISIPESLFQVPQGYTVENPPPPPSPNPPSSTPGAAPQK